MISKDEMEKLYPQPWIEDNLSELREAGFTDNDLFNTSLPIGINSLLVWDKKNLSVTLVDTVVLFSWENPQGKVITQIARVVHP